MLDGCVAELQWLHGFTMVFVCKNDDVISFYLCGKRESETRKKRPQEIKAALVVCIVFMYLAYLKYIDIEAGVKGWSDVDMAVSGLFSGVFMLRTTCML